MSKIKCKCGHVISDIISPSSTEGEILPEINSEDLLAQIGEMISSFIEKQDSGNHKAWLKDKFGEEYPVDAELQEVIQDSIDYSRQSKVLSVAECDICGSLHVQTAPGSNEYVSFSPESGKYESILNPKKTK